MRLVIACIAALALLAAPAMACPPVDDGGSFSFGGGYGADMCEAPALAGNFGGGYGGGASFAVPSYSASFAAPSYGVQSFAAPSYHVRTFAAPRVYAAPVRVRSFAARRYGYGAGVIPAPIRVRAFAAPAYGVTAVAPVVAVPVRAPGPIRGALSGFRAGLRNRLSGF